MSEQTSLAVATLEEQTALVEKDHELAELRKRLEAFDEAVATVRHDTNNPLAVVLGQAQFLIRRSQGLPEDVLRRLRVIEEMAQRMRQTLNLLETLKQKNRDNNETGC